MLKDIAAMNPKGHVKLELYNEDGVFFTKEKHNLVVLDANKIVAGMMANPSKKIRISKTMKVDTTVNAEGKHVIELPFASEKVFSVEKDLGSENVTEFQIDGAANVTTILEASLNDSPIQIGSSVFIKDGVKGIIGFGGTGATGVLKLKYRKVVNPLTELVKGTEVVTIGPNVWKKGVAPVDANTTYTVDAATGVLTFENAKAAVNISYDYEMKYALGFMGIGGLPEGRTPYQPISFSKSEKFRSNLDNEFADARQPIQFPATVEEGKPEVDVLLAKNVSVVTKSGITLHLTDNGVKPDRNYTLDISTQGGNRPIYRLTSVTAIDGSNAGYDFLANGKVSVTDAETGKIAFATDAPIEIGQSISLNYELVANNDHLRYQLNFSPVVELKSVRFEDNLGVVHDIPVDVNTKGMELGAEGKVQVINPNAGIIEFSKDVESILLNLPGTLTVEYFVNSGTVVKFVADFPKGVPGPVVVNADDFTPDTSSGATTYELPSKVNQIKHVFVAGEETQAYSINGQQITITDPAFSAGVNLTIQYETLKESHDIYTVAMFDGIDPATSKMFNISGIGPVTKDQNTGMRITWSVTF